MHQNINSEISKLVNIIKDVASINKIYLFGSFAYGNPSIDSDLDLCIVINDNIIRKREVIKSIRKAISKIAEISIDILVYYKDEFYERSVVESTLEHKILCQGVSVYEQ